MDSTTGLTIALITPDNSPEQFASLRHTGNTFRKNLGLRSVKKKVLRAFGSSSNVSSISSVSTPVAGQRSNHSINNSGDDLSGITEDSLDSERKSPNLDDSAWKMKDENEDGVYDDEEEKDDHGKGIAQRISVGKAPSLNLMDENLGEEKEKDVNNEAPLLTALQVALSAKQQEEMMNSYLQSACAMHFVFRCDIYVGNGDTADGGMDTESSGAMLTQCFGPAFSFPFIDDSSQRHILDVYQRLSLRLRLGSSSVEATMDALHMITEGICLKNTLQNAPPQKLSQIESQRSCQDCPMQSLLESPPNVHSVTYLQEDNELLFVGLNGRYFELYATLPATIPPKTGTAYCARLVRRLMGDERILFLSSPPTWGS